MIIVCVKCAVKVVCRRVILSSTILLLTKCPTLVNRGIHIPVIRCKYPITRPGVARSPTLNEYNVAVNLGIAAETGVRAWMISRVE